MGKTLLSALGLFLILLYFFIPALALAHISVPTQLVPCTNDCNVCHLYDLAHNRSSSLGNRDSTFDCSSPCRGIFLADFSGLGRKNYQRQKHPFLRRSGIRNSIWSLGDNKHNYDDVGI